MGFSFGFRRVAMRMIAGFLHAALFCALPNFGQTASTSPESSIAEGSAAFAKGEYAHAEREFRRALLSDPRSVPLLNNLALAIARQGRPLEAIAPLRQALALRPGDAMTERNLGVTLFRAQHYADALPLLERAAAGAPNFQLLDLTGLSLFALDRYPEAARYLERAHTVTPTDLETLYVLGKCYLRTKNYAGVQDVFRQIMVLSPSSAEAHVMLATAYDSLFREEDAIREFQAAERADPEFPGVHTGLGVIYWRNANPTAAKQEFLLALKQSPKDPVANCTLGRIVRREERPAEAVTYFNAALAVNPSYRDALLELGQSLLSLHEPAQAIDPLRRAAALEPKDAEGHYILGTALRESGQVAAGTEERAKAGRLLSEQHRATSNPPSESAP